MRPGPRPLCRACRSRGWSPAFDLHQHPLAHARSRRQCGRATQLTLAPQTAHARRNRHDERRVTRRRARGRYIDRHGHYVVSKRMAMSEVNLFEPAISAGDLAAAPGLRRPQHRRPRRRRMRPPAASRPRSACRGQRRGPIGTSTSGARPIALLGAKPQRTPCSAEALRRRLSVDGAPPRVNAIVDLYNAISLRYARPRRRRRRCRLRRITTAGPRLRARALPDDSRRRRCQRTGRAGEVDLARRRRRDMRGDGTGVRRRGPASTSGPPTCGSCWRDWTRCHWMR